MSGGPANFLTVTNPGPLFLRAAQFTSVLTLLLFGLLDDGLDQSNFPTPKRRPAACGSRLPGCHGLPVVEWTPPESEYLPHGGQWHVRFNSGAKVYDPSFENGDSFDTTASQGGMDGLNFNANVGIGPYSVVILSQ